MENDPAIETLERILRELKGESQVNGYAKRNEPLDLLALRSKEFDFDWLVERFWPLGAHLHIFASPKTGKSLLGLWMAANMALGVDPFTWEKSTPRIVAYIDNEMTEQDVQERLNDMGFDYDKLDGWLRYFCYPVIAPMDTELGGFETLQLMQDEDAGVLIIDTLSRVVKGEENSNDTYRNFYNYTGRLLKAHDKSVLRFDHAGHDPKRSRGASAKADDVDLVFSLERRSDSHESPGFRLARTHARVSGISEMVELAMTDDPFTIKSTHARTWSEPAIKKAKELEAANIPVAASVREVQNLLVEAGYSKGKTTVLMEAIKLRQWKDPFSQFGA
jgi:AAA domain-containing protein